MTLDWRTTEDDWAARQAVLVGAADLTALAVCQASCPWRGGPPQACAMKQCCPRLCRGCEAGWGYDADGRHIGPIKAPHYNRWECNRVKWLGLRGMQPCDPTGALQVWMNDALQTVLWVNNSGASVGWVSGSAVQCAGTSAVADVAVASCAVAA